MIQIVRFVKPAVGLLLIICSITAVIWWESAGREEFMMDKVLVAKEDLQKGMKAERNLFIEINATKESVIKNAYGGDEFAKIDGLEVKQFIPRNSQISKEFFVGKEKGITMENTIFPLKEEWIQFRSSSLRKGDTIELYDEKGELFIGSFQIAFVRDTNEQEVTSMDGSLNGEILERGSATSVISFVEIVASLEAYKQIVQHAEDGMKFLIVQREEEENEYK